jgi:DNA transformation protein
MLRCVDQKVSSIRPHDFPMTHDSFVAYVLEQLAGLGRVRSRRMFGGAGLYCDGLFFALIDDDTLYLKVDDSTREEFLALGLRPFQPFRDKPEYSMSYYQAPADALDDAEALVGWARKAVRAAETARASTTRAKRSGRAKQPRRKSRVAVRVNPTRR